jgi:hypothetical protein
LKTFNTNNNAMTILTQSTWLHSQHHRLLTCCSNAFRPMASLLCPVAAASITQLVQSCCTCTTRIAANLLGCLQQPRNRLDC